MKIKRKKLYAYELTIAQFHIIEFIESSFTRYTGYCYMNKMLIMLWIKNNLFIISSYKIVQCKKIWYIYKKDYIFKCTSLKVVVYYFAICLWLTRFIIKSDIYNERFSTCSFHVKCNTRENNVPDLYSQLILNPRRNI